MEKVDELIKKMAGDIMDRMEDESRRNFFQNAIVEETRVLAELISARSRMISWE